MFQFFLGSIFILLDFNVQLGQTVSIGLLPATVGYVLWAVGLKKMRFYCPRYKKLDLYVVLMIFYSLALYCFDLFGITNGLGAMGTLLSAISFAYCVFILYQLIRGIQEMEDMYSIKLNSYALKTNWLLVALAGFAGFAARLFSAELSAMVTLASFIVDIIFLLALRKSCNTFRALRPSQLELPEQETASIEPSESEIASGSAAC